jgi:anaerobic magnesium-protoporphyrin IX monomethyl ester cyclase
MKFLLIFPPSGKYILSRKKNISFGSYLPPIGMLYVASSLENDGHTLEVFDYHFEEEPEEKIQNLSSYDAVGICVHSKDFGESASVAKKIKINNPDIPIIIGGPHCTFHPKKCLEDIPDADISIEGEGEYAIKDVVKSLNGKKRFSESKGVYYKENGEIKKGKPAEVIMDLDSLSFPARHLVDKYDYGKMKGISFGKKKFTTIITSRGCPFRCKFCTRHVTTMETFRKRSSENIVKEFQEINDKFRSVMVIDDNFLVDTKRAHRIMDELIKMDLSLDIYIGGARVDTAERDLYKKMKKAGVKFIGFGIESGNQDVLDFYNKKITLSQIRKAVNLAEEMDFMTMGSFILGAPIETEEHINQTINFSCSLPLDIAFFNPLSYQYGSDLWREAVENGKFSEDGYSHLADSRENLSNFTIEELRRFCGKAFKKFYLRPNYIIRQFKKSLTRNDNYMIKMGIKTLIH